MMKIIFTHVYVIVMAIFIVMTGNILADKYGAAIISKISNLSASVDRDVGDMQRSVKSWNKNLLD